MIRKRRTAGAHAALASGMTLVFVGLVLIGGLCSPARASSLSGPVVAALTLNPSTIDGGSGGTSTATVTLSAPAPTGGQIVSLSSDTPALAATPPSTTVPAGQSSANFTVWTNPKYRHYSGLSFTATISASANGGSRSASLFVTAQPLPADIQNDTADRYGDVCGGSFPATFGEKGILYTCFTGPTPGTAGHCTFKEECLISGCEPQAANGFQFGDICGSNSAYPLAFTPSVVAGASSATGTVTSFFPAPASGSLTTLEDPLYCVTVPFNVTIPQGATTANFGVTNTDSSTAHFAGIGIAIPYDSGPAAQLGLSYYTVLPSGQCSPATCASLGRNCDIWPDGCCGYVSCGSCSSPDICGGGGVQGVCGCTPTNTCAYQGWVCGSASDGCGGTLNCGSCPTGQYCDLYHFCASCPDSCTMLGFNCGSTTDPCKGAKLNCGTCPNKESCINNVCCVPQNACANNGFNCGSASDGCGGTLNCGTCPSGQTCVNNVCTVGGCVPVTCSYLGMNCGTTSDGCGGTLNCGKCSKTQSCLNNVCR